MELTSSTSGNSNAQPNTHTTYSTFPYQPLEEAEENEDDEENQYTMQEAIDTLGFGRFQMKVSAIAGMCYMCDSMEMMLLTVLSPILKCVFYLSSTQEALLTTVVFLGMFISSSPWGIFCDKYGRKVTLLYFIVYTGYFGMLTSLSPSYVWVAINRFLVGTGVGGAAQAVTFYSEFLPTSSRSACIMFMSVLWAFGACAEVFLAIFVLPNYGWRWLLVLTAMPLVVLAFFSKRIPESPRHHLAHGHYDRAMACLHEIARENASKLPKGKLYDPCFEQTPEKASLADLFSPSLRRTTILLTIAWVIGNMSYYGTALLTTALFDKRDGCHGYDVVLKEPDEKTCNLLCRSLTSGDYVDLFVTSTGDLPGVLLTMFLMSRFSTKRILGLLLLAYSITMGVCNVCAPRLVLVTLLFIARALISGASQGCYVYGAEIFPTSVRAMGMGWCSGMTRLGIMGTSFIAQVLIHTSSFLSISTFAVLGFIGAVCTFCLPIDTYKRRMQDTLSDK